jgi:uncharacterized protein YjbI with pentapeptide repeats
VSELVCACKEEFRSVCKGLPADNEHEGKQYCALHAPTKDKNLVEVGEAIKKKFRDKDFDFRGVYFPRDYFRSAGIEEQFAGISHANWAGLPQATLDRLRNRSVFEEEADFSNATFEGERADFSDAHFKRGAIFSEATFEEGADFSGVIFEEGADFSNATFEGCASFAKAAFGEKVWKGKGIFFEAEEWTSFSGATFKKRADFSNATFEDLADFLAAIFKEGAMFWFLKPSPQAILTFRAAIVEKPGRVSFHTTHLRPSWFIDVDAQKFDFSDVEWFRLPDGNELKLEKEIEDLGGVTSRLRKLQKACRKLMDNAEENRDYATANELHYWSMELLRKEGWRELGLIGTLYWALSGYGERPRRAFLVLAGMWALFAFFYAMVAGAIEHVGQAALYSLAAIVRLTDIPAMAEVTTLLQPSEAGLFQVLVAVEGILGPLQIALLVLAIRRRVMR